MRNRNRFPSGSRRIFAVLIGIAITATAGIADADLATKSNSTTIDAAGSGSATAKCRRGSEAVSAGFHNPDFATANGPQIFPFSSKRLGDRRWKGSAADIGGDSGEFIVYAYCDRHEPGLKRESDGVTVAQNSTGSATARCNPGSEAVSGGFARSNAAIYPYSSKRKGARNWKVSAYSYAGSGTLTVFAYCDNDGPSLYTRSSSTTIDPSEVGSATARCTRGSEAVASGFKGPFEGGAEIFPFTSKRKGDRRWKASGWNDGSAPGEFTAVVYCDR